MTSTSATSGLRAKTQKRRSAWLSPNNLEGIANRALHLKGETVDEHGRTYAPDLWFIIESAYRVSYEVIGAESGFDISIPGSNLQVAIPGSGNTVPYSDIRVRGGGFEVSLEDLRRDVPFVVTTPRHKIVSLPKRPPATLV